MAHMFTRSVTDIVLRYGRFLILCDPKPDHVFFFFFQAEDGIRDGHVTGVQTCALPIWGAPERCKRRGRRKKIGGPRTQARSGCERRLEERRVGKECRSRWSPYH